jgi:FtsH-binding integral membrane protein
MTPRFSPIIDVSSRSLPTVGLAPAYWLLALAMLMTGVGVALGATFALPLLASNLVFLLFLVEFGIIFTAPAWVRRSPINIILFVAFPLLSGLTITPFLLSVAYQYANGAVILLNAVISTVLLSASAAVFASFSRDDLSRRYGFFVFQALIGLIVFGLLQMFIPSLRGTAFEMIVSGVGIVTFTLFLAIDIQRLQRLGRAESPFLLALSLYLDVFNLFLYVVRFMIAISGRRR